MRPLHALFWRFVCGCRLSLARHVAGRLPATVRHFGGEDLAPDGRKHQLHVLRALPRRLCQSVCTCASITLLSLCVQFNRRMDDWVSENDIVLLPSEAIEARSYVLSPPSTLSPV